MGSRGAVAGALVVGIVAAACVAAACVDPPLQGEEYRPDRRLPLGTPTARGDGGTCDGEACDGGAAPPSRPAAVPPSNTCTTARPIGAIAGDVAGLGARAQGACSEWLLLRADEAESSTSGAPMRVVLALASTEGDFDLYVHFDPLRDLLSCATPYASSLARDGATAPITLTWGEGSVPNGGDDGRTIAIAVVRPSGECPATGGWTLTATGGP